MQRILALLFALALPGGIALGQSLGELAENTRKKRKGGAKTYSEEDLKKRSEAPSPSPGVPDPGRAAAAGATGGGGEGGSVESGAGGEGGEDGEGAGRSAGRNDEAYWRTQAASHRAALQRAERRIAAAQRRLNALMSDLVPTNVTDPFQQQTLEGERAKARRELEEAEKELELAEDAFHEFEEEARRKAVPPGWLEER